VGFEKANIYASPQELLNDRNAGATGIFIGYFKTILTVAFPPSREKHRYSRAVILMH
jgi:hypothetical protein